MDEESRSQHWDPDGYARNARFVADLGAPVVDLLGPRAGERILDLGCGDGALTEKLARLGCEVVGIDGSAEQVAAARARGLDARVGDGEALDFDEEFDAVFSNAALHWMRRPDRVLDGVWRALRSGGRFVAEMGGEGCVATIHRALLAALERRGVDSGAVDPWYFPTAEEYGSRLGARGFAVESITLFPRPTPLPGDLDGWLATFAQVFTRAVAVDERPRLLAEVRAACSPRLAGPDGRWTADYVRLRFRAREAGLKITEDEVRDGLRRERYVTTPRVEIALTLALALEKPLLVEGPAGAGKTEIAKVLAAMLETDLVRLQCYEGLDESRALYEWNYQKQLLRLQADRALDPERQAGSWSALSRDVFSREYLLERPLLRAITAERRVVLLVDEIDKADEEFEAFLLEILSDFQVTVPELGTIPARERPVVVLTSNQARELSEALKRRCLHLYVDFPGVEKEAEILALKVPEADAALREAVARFVHRLRGLDLKKAPSIAETLDWCRALVALGVPGLDAAAVRRTSSLLLKHEEDVKRAEPKIAALVADATRAR